MMVWQRLIVSLLMLCGVVVYTSSAHAMTVRERYLLEQAAKNKPAHRSSAKTSAHANTKKANKKAKKAAVVKKARSTKSVKAVAKKPIAKKTALKASRTKKAKKTAVKKAVAKKAKTAKPHRTTHRA